MKLHLHLNEEDSSGPCGFRCCVRSWNCCARFIGVTAAAEAINSILVVSDIGRDHELLLRCSVSQQSIKRESGRYS